MSLKVRILAGDAEAWGRYADVARHVGFTYREVHERICELHVAAGKPAPTLIEYEEKMQEVEYLLQRARSAPSSGAR